MSETPKLVWLLTIGALAVALLEMPYGYYQILRVLVFCVSAYLAYQSKEAGATAWTWIFAGVAIIYNPIFKVHLGAEIWPIANLVTIGILAGHLWHTSKQRLPSDQ